MLSHFLYIEQLKEQLKSYYIATRYDTEFAQQLLADINAKRLLIALDAELREIFYEQQDIPANASGYQQSHWFSKNDIEYNIRRALANLGEGVTISAVNQGNAQRIITREPISWQHIFPNIQNLAAPLGQQTLFDFPQEMLFAENEALGLSIFGQVAAGNIFYHGCTLKDEVSEVRQADIAREISAYLPQPQYVPLIFQFPSAVVGSAATNPSGGADIFSAKNERSVVLTHVSTTAPNSRLTLLDEGRNQTICTEVEQAGVAGTFTDAFEVFYPLPYPHLLRRGDRLRIKVLQGSPMYGEVQPIDTLNYLTFKGYSL